jgi:hypothetical protein
MPKLTTMKKLFTLLVLLTFHQLLSVAQVNLSNGLVAYYPLNGNAGDSSGQGNHAIASSGASVVLSKKSDMTLQVYPNPANEKLTVSGLTGKAQVYDITGKQQLEIIADGEIDITHLPAGIYFLRTANDAVKIVKQ